MDVFVQELMASLGAFGIALLMFLENIFPPIPSELIMPLAGYQAAKGEMSIGTVIVAGTAGSLAGVTPWYYLGKLVGYNRMLKLSARYGRWLTLTPGDVEAAARWFERRGTAAVLFGRLIPTVRTLISVPAGVARMGLPRFLVYSAVGSALWTAALAYAGYGLGQNYAAVEGYVGPVSDAVVVLAVLVYLYRVVTFDPKRRRSASGETAHNPIHEEN
ncbi:DedA family protein [Mangrovibrevibacter kandeliae]|uniref:DedA family protein n=1 Tax=Mangrovibrevibacter kandeliae TaxID=2968473 RepID=UPI002117B91B|nr:MULTISPECIES: DedA family protein [unclassified Aurantimonas]MCQ8783937.1 DedA family protein [Aurantimonas sp. CSK15Z-1]MCW4116655.1 DedA family protein [Aurantimonas sp. MSK8Z-1]